MSGFAGRFASLIEAEGPQPVARFMAEAVAHYYGSRDPFGQAGDFVTAPEVSQMFGELIGLWAADLWDRAGRPAPLRLIELGPGRGTLMRDAWRAVAKALPDFCAAASIHMVEQSPVLAARQREALARLPAEWHGDLDQAPPGFGIVIANEFFDALPIRQFVRGALGWHERLVGLGAGGGLAFALSPVLPDVSGGRRSAAAPSFETRPARAPQDEAAEFRVQSNPHPEEPPARGRLALRQELKVRGRGWAPYGLPEAPEGTIVEASPARTAYAQRIAARLVRDGGAALLIDYGHAASGAGDTLQAMKAHRFVAPLEEAGEADLTSHVDFEALGRAARAAGARVAGPAGQGAFLDALGIAARAARLKRAAPDQAAAIDAAVARLTGAEAMGSLFLVMALLSPSCPPPAGLPPAGLSA